MKAASLYKQYLYNVEAFAEKERCERIKLDLGDMEAVIRELGDARRRYALWALELQMEGGEWEL